MKLRVWAKANFAVAIAYTSTHFATEEAAMEKNDYRGRQRKLSAPDSAAALGVWFPTAVTSDMIFSTTARSQRAFTPQ